MSKVFIREPVPVTERKAMTPARKRRISQRQKGLCAYPDCEAPIDEYDHIVCLGLGGRDTDDNCEGLCAEHHRIKTNRDLKLIAKARHQRAFHEGARPKPIRQIKSRGFAPSKRERDPLYD